LVEGVHKCLVKLKQWDKTPDMLSGTDSSHL